MEQLKNEKFLIIKNVKKFILGLESLLVTFPKKDTFSKDRVYNDALELIEYITLANYEKRKDMKVTYQIKALDKINKLTFRENIKKTSEMIVIKKVDLYRLVLDVLLLNEECYDELL